MPTDVYSEFEWRGMVYEGTEGVRDVLAREKVTCYIGFDPTASSLHVGSLLPLMALARLQRFGHSPIAIAGGGTGMIGDPSGRTQERQLLSLEQIDDNLNGIRAQLERFLDFNASPNPARIVNNADWLAKLSLMEFLRDTGKHFTVNYMLAKESVKRRIEQEDGISYTEFTYLMLQAFDFLTLFDRYRCTLQLGGSDQWGNITAGCDLIRKLRGGKAHGLVMPLVTTAAGVKFGKTEAGAVWLDPARTSDFQFFQFWLNTDDRDAVKYLKYFTFLTEEPVAALERGHRLLGQEREVLQVFHRVAVVGIEPELEELEVRRAGRVEPDGASFRLPELHAGGRRHERHHEAVRLSAAKLANEIASGGDIAPLVAATELQRAPVAIEQRQEVEGLKHEIRELGIRDPVLLLDAALHRLLREHVVHGEVLARVAQELHQAQLRQPVGVVDDARGVGGGVEVEEAFELGANAIQVVVDLLEAQELAFLRPAARVADHARAAAGDGNRAVAEALQARERHQWQQRPDVQARRGRVEADIAGHLLAREDVAHALGALVNHPPPLELAVHVSRHRLSSSASVRFHYTFSAVVAAGERVGSGTQAIIARFRAFCYYWLSLRKLSRMAGRSACGHGWLIGSRPSSWSLAPVSWPRWRPSRGCRSSACWFPTFRRRAASWWLAWPLSLWRGQGLRCSSWPGSHLSEALSICCVACLTA